MLLFTIVFTELATTGNWWFSFLLAGFSATLGLVYTLYVQAKKDRKEAEDALLVWKQDIDKQLTVLNTQVTPLWATVQAKLTADLHHPHPRYLQMDKLLEKLDTLTISDDERIVLKELLVKRSVDTHEDITEGQRESALLLLGVMKKVLTEADTPGRLTHIGLVGTKEESAEKGQGEKI